MEKYLLAILIFFYSCSENNDIVDSKPMKIMTENYASMVEANSIFCETLQFYEQKITFTDTTKSTVKSYFDIKELVEAYLWVHKKKGCIEEIKRNKLMICGEQINNKMVFVLDSLIKRNIEYDKKPWKEYVEKIEDNLEALNRIQYSSEFTAKKSATREAQITQWLLRVEQVYNLIFQLAIRHKIEEEYRYEIRVPKVFEDIVFDNGKRKLTVYAYCGELTDGQSLELYIGDEKVGPVKIGGEVNSGEFSFVYDPKITGDSLLIKTVSETYINGEVVTAEMKYGIPK